MSDEPINMLISSVPNLSREEQNEYWGLVEIIQNITGTTKWVVRGDVMDERLVQPLLRRIHLLYCRNKTESDKKLDRIVGCHLT